MTARAGKAWTVTPDSRKYNATIQVQYGSAPMQSKNEGSQRRLCRRVAAIAMASALGMASSAPMAAIIDSGPVNLPVVTNIDGLYLNLVTGASANATIAGWDFNAYATGGNLNFFTSSLATSNTQVVGALLVVNALAAGTTVGPASTYANAGVLAATAFRVTATQFVGLRFTNESTGVINYGYVQLQTTAATGFPATVTRYVYENTGQPIVIAGPTPVFLGAASRKVHGPVGALDLPLSAVTTNPTTEPRLGPNLTLVFSFDKPMLAAGGVLTTPEGSATFATEQVIGNDIVVDFTAVPDQQYLTVNLTGLNSVDGGTGGAASIRLGLLAGDVNQNRVVTLADLGLVNQQLAQPVTAANYLKDVNFSGTLSLADKGLTNTKLTHSLPAP
jgi:hypothetical protein